MSANTSYRLSVPSPHTHLIEVEARFPDAVEHGPHVDLHMAAWTPGSYLVRDYARHVQDVTAADGSGRSLSVIKQDKATWRVSLDGAKDSIVRYRVYAWELTVRTSHVDDTHAFVNGAPTWLWLKERAERPFEIHTQFPAGWPVTCGLPRRDGVLHARNLDELLDSPIHAGSGRVLHFQAAGKPHELAVWGRPEAVVADLDRLASDSAAIVEVYARLFEGVPYDRYAFQLMLAPGAYGGLEHRASTALLSTPFAFSTRKKYEELLELVSHEYFHLWNVKRIHPKTLGPFDYTGENYTRALWVMEGVTSYYDRYTLRRAELMPAKRYLAKLAEEWGKLLAIPGRFKQSIEESSFDAWIKLYRPDENSVNSTVSYYLKGGLVALCLDLEIRRRTTGKRSLDDVMRALWKSHGIREVGFDETTFQSEVERAVDSDLSTFFERNVRGRQDPDLAGELESVGLELRATWERPFEGKSDDGPSPAWLGVVTKSEAGRAVVASTLSGAPAEAGGLYAGDEIVALDGWKVNEAGLGDRLSARRPGETVQLTVFRRDELRHVSITLGAAPKDKLEILPLKTATDAQKSAYQAWMGEALA